VEQRARNSAKALIVQDRKLLVLRCRDLLDENFDEYFALPGGGQEHGEALEQTLRRECQEDINVDVEVNELVFVREYIGKNHGFVPHKHVHQVDFAFLCTIREGEPAIGHSPDTEQIGVVWLALDELENSNFYPHGMRKLLATVLSCEVLPAHPVYLGDIN
jgi:8-oxo-dGTP diphosphatase